MQQQLRVGRLRPEIWRPVLVQGGLELQMLRRQEVAILRWQTGRRDSGVHLLSVPVDDVGLFLAAMNIQLVVTVAAVVTASLVATVGVPRLLERQNQDEALRELARLSKAAAVYYVKPRMDGKSGVRAICSFPLGDIRTSLAKSCCDPQVGDGNGLCLPAKMEWNRTLWGALKWKLAEPHAYIYEYRGEGTLGQSKFTVSAYADLDCDGEFATFRYVGHGGAASQADDCVISEAPEFIAINPDE